jgi:hypothetical protein
MLHAVLGINGPFDHGRRQPVPAVAFEAVAERGQAVLWVAVGFRTLEVESERAVSAVRDGRTTAAKSTIEIASRGSEIDKCSQFGGTRVRARVCVNQSVPRPHRTERPEAWYR